MVPTTLHQSSSPLEVLIQQQCSLLIPDIHSSLLTYFVGSLKNLLLEDLEAVRSSKNYRFNVEFILCIS